MAGLACGLLSALADVGIREGCHRRIGGDEDRRVA